MGREERTGRESPILSIPIWLGLPGISDGKESAWNAGDLGSSPWLGRSPGEGNGNPLQYSCLENSMDREAWQATVHRVTNNRIWLNDLTLIGGTIREAWKVLRTCKWEQDRVKVSIKYLACSGSWGTRVGRRSQGKEQVFFTMGKKPLTQAWRGLGWRLGLCGWSRKWGPGTGRWGWYSQGAGCVVEALWGHHWLSPSTPVPDE